MTKVALITAGSSGMGADSARALAGDGFKVTILSSSGKSTAGADSWRHATLCRGTGSPDDRVSKSGHLPDRRA